jgi:hypothetical protein
VIPASGSGVYTSSNFDQSLFLTSTHFGYGRLTTYRDMGGNWFPSGMVAGAVPNMPYDDHDPVDGWLDSISPSGLASGWTCDQDAPNNAIKVDLYAGDNWTFAATGYANLSSEAAVNSLCWGGFAHRFQIQLPSWSQGQNIRAYGLDYTWYGFTELHCGQDPSRPCFW